MIRSEHYHRHRGLAPALLVLFLVSLCVVACGGERRGGESGGDAPLPVVAVYAAPGEGRADTAAPREAAWAPTAEGEGAGAAREATSAPARAAGGQSRRSPSGSRIEARQIASAALGRTLPYLIFLPTGYDDDPDVRYPVLYMLHGFGADMTEWRRVGLLDTADRLIRAREIAPLLIVLPTGEESYFIDHAEGGPRWGTYLTVDLVGEIDARFRTRADRGARAAGGLSMGGHAALQLALNHPELFGIAGAHSPTIRHREIAPPFFGDDEYFARHDPPSLFRARPDVARTLALWIDIGEEDLAWLPVTAALHEQLEEQGVPHEWHLWPGEHFDDYWRAHTADYLRFYTEAFALADR